jgi:hypothetical protein
MLFTNFVFNAIDAIELDDEDEGTIEILHRPMRGIASFSKFTTAESLSRIKNGFLKRLKVRKNEAMD